MGLEEVLSMIVSGPALAAVCIVVYMHRQDSQSLHQSIDNNTNALKGTGRAYQRNAYRAGQGRPAA